MAIHPHYANAILEGDKKIEFRKRRTAPDVTTVLIYATSPVSAIVGRFRIADIVQGTPQQLWEGYGEVGRIGHEDYCRYYAASEKAYGLLVEDAERLPLELPLSDLSPSPAVPQSFSYLPANIYYNGGCLGDPNQYKLW